MTVDYYEEISECCRKISELDDPNFIVALGLIGFGRILEFVRLYEKNYRMGKENGKTDKV